MSRFPLLHLPCALGAAPRRAPALRAAARFPFRIRPTLALLLALAAAATAPAALSDPLPSSASSFARDTSIEADAASVDRTESEAALEKVEAAASMAFARSAKEPLAARAADSGGRTGAAPSPRKLADRIAARYGLADFPKAESIRFTIHFRDREGTRVRHWTWFPRSDSVTYQGEDAKGLNLRAEYCRRNRFSMESATIARIDEDFRRDRFWLFLPLQLSWDRDLVLGGGKGGRLTVRFPAEKGSPAQPIYEIEAAPDGVILSATLYRAETAAIRTEWSAPVVIGGLPLSLERKGPRDFGIRFTDIEVGGLQ